MKLLMLRPTVLLTVAALAAPAWADMDHEAERRRQAERNAAAQAAAKKQQEANAIRHDAMMRGYRQMLGPKAAGKSDAEVVQMVQQMQGDAAAQARQAAAAPRPVMPARSQAQMEQDAAQGMDMLRRANGGRALSQDQLANMSDAELDALARRAASQAQRR